MNGITSNTTSENAFVSESGVALIVYILYLIGFLTGITAAVGVIVAYLYRRSASQQVATHFQFQIRTFWFGAICFVIGWPLWHFIIGIPLLLWWGVWTLLRVIRGVLLLNQRKPIPNPKSLLFGGSETLAHANGVVTGSQRSPMRWILPLVCIGVVLLVLFELGMIEEFWHGFAAGLADAE